jgi:predicted N-acetyltransferase YhbS
MTDVTILQERAEDSAAIERLHDRVFGPGRYAKTAYRIREQVPHSLDLSYTAWIGTLMVGSIWMSKVRIGETPALLLGPLTVEPPFRERGIGQLLMQRAMDDARGKGHKLVVLVGDEPYYAKVGFKAVPKGQCTMPGPVDPARLLVCELVEAAFRDVTGPIRGDV